MKTTIRPKAATTNTRKTSALIVEVIRRAADRIGAHLLVEPEWTCVGQLTYKSGVRRYFRLSTLDLNTMGASEIARDKGFARFFLEAMGYPIPEGKTFLSPKWAKTLRSPERGGIDNAWGYARSIGVPVFIKPNSLSRGVGVSKAETKSEFYRASREAMRHDRVIVVEKAVLGRDYRLVVLDGQVISAYERIPLTIVGDGLSTIHELLDMLQIQFDLSQRETIIDRTDFRLLTNLSKLNLSFDTILAQGRKVHLLDIANLSAGGTSVDVTDTVDPGFQDLVAKIAHDMGLRLVGVDLIVEGDLSKPPRNGHFWVIEINSAPGLDHYAAMGERQKQIVDDLYLRVVIAMERPQEAVANVDGRMRAKWYRS